MRKLTSTSTTTAKQTVFDPKVKQSIDESLFQVCTGSRTETDRESVSKH